MTLSEILSICTTLLAIAVAVAAIIRNRRQPQLNAAQTVSALVSSDAVKAEIERTTKALNANRDLRVLDLEIWADHMRPCIRSIQARDDVMCDALRVAYTRLELPMPDLPAFPEIPEFPPPRPI